MLVPVQVCEVWIPWPGKLRNFILSFEYIILMFYISSTSRSKMNKAVNLYQIIKLLIANIVKTCEVGFVAVARQMVLGL